ncbi:MAG: permease [Planctomycetes bacterium]|nr:permease [Planctomycetota bacterium]
MMDRLMEISLAALAASLELLLEVLPFFALGVLLAGVLSSLGGRAAALARLGRSPLAIVAGAALGCVLPVCSCGVVPVALGLLAGGVAPGPVFAFLAAAPMVNPASFVLTAGVMGTGLAMGRLLGAIVLGCGIGFIAARWSPTALARLRGTCGCGAAASASPAAWEGPRSAASRIGIALHAGGRTFVSLLPYVALGTALGGILSAALDPSTVTRHLSGPLSVPLAALAGTALYLCSCAEVPVAASLVRQGLEPAAVLTFLLAGPGVSLFSLILLSSVLRLRWILVYAAWFLAGSTVIGFIWLGIGS